MSPVDRPDVAEDDAVVGFEATLMGIEAALVGFEVMLVDTESEPVADSLMVLMVDVLICVGSFVPH